MNVELFNVEPRTRWEGTRAIVPTYGAPCHRCGTSYRIRYVQPALFFHGGYGAAEERATTYCECGLLSFTRLSLKNPRHLGDQL